MRFFFFSLVCIVQAVAASDPGYANRDIELRAEPVAGAQVVGTVQKGVKFEIVAEQKAWAQVKSGPLAGWTLMFYVMKGEPPQGVTAGRTLSEVWNLGTDRSRGQITSTIGIRGLDEEELRAAQFNAGEMKRLEALALPRQAGEQFAREGALAARPVEYLPGPVQPGGDR